MKNFPNEFGRSRKMTEGNDFKLAITLGSREKFSTFSLYSHPNKKGQARLGIAVSRKVSKKAVTRNTLKRIIREAFRVKAKNLQALDFFFKVRPINGAPNKVLLKKEVLNSLCKVTNTKADKGK